MSNVMKSLVNIQKTQQLGLIRFLCNYGKEIGRPIGQDLLMQDLKSAGSAHNVLDMVASHYSIMNSKHSMQALRTIFELQKNERNGVSMKSVLKHPNFVKLCKKLKSHSGHIELNETIEALKVLTFLGAPSDSIINQILLQLIRQNINFLSLNHIMFLDFLLGQYKSTPLVDALKIALPMVFEINLPIKMERNNLTQLTECLYYASRTKLNKNSVQLIVDSLCRYNDTYDPKNAKSIIWSITDLPEDDLFKPLLEKAINSLSVDLERISYGEIDSTLSRMILKYSAKYPFYYNEVFLDSCVNYVIDNDLGLEKSLCFLRKFIRVNHWNKYLLDYTCKKIIEDPKFFKSEVGNVYALVCSMCLTDYRPKEWESVKEIIKGIKNMPNNCKRDVLWMRFGAALCLLDIYKLDVLSKCLNETYLDSLFKKKVFMSDIEHFLTIWYSLDLYKQDFLDLLPDKYNLKFLHSKMWYITEFPLKGALEKGVGGQEYVLTNVKSKIGHQIDHAILFRKGGFPVAVQNENVEFIEDISIPEDHQLVCIFYLKPICYTINKNMLREGIRFSLNYLEQKGYPTISINGENWHELEDFEKIPYIMQNIKTKVESDSISQSVNC
ncbi:unnamed protein product [Brassicogethes aeneus]|uniref:Uncharacterized protein n=1 Tax=Brassicogethes aeneus TaxID=1431903 RepID=A0A9P0FCG8_BRAAE|nr:unnamed protein product [Brassicogethes aeneus]